jgi:hypothetical protein
MRGRAELPVRDVGSGNAPTIDPGQESSISWIAQAARGDFSPDKAVNDQLATLDTWATTTEEQATQARARFWFLKGPAFTCAVGAPVFESFGYGHAVIVLGALAAIAIAVDAAWSGPTNPLLERAIRDIRNLQNTVKLRWDKVRIAHPEPKDPARTEEALAILDAVEATRDEISKYLANPQASPR